MNAARAKPVAAALLLAAVGGSAARGSDWPRTPREKESSVIVPPAERDGRASYPAFPALLPLGDASVLVVYKEGRGHALDPGAEIVTFERDLVQGTQRALQRFAPPVPLLFQCAEPVRFANGSVALLIDTQRIGPEPRHYRAPMRWTRSRDGGRTFGPPVVFPTVDGVGYGYPFEGHTIGGATYVLVMTFGYLEGGRWSVDIIRTPDSGATWSLVRNLAVEFSVPGFNEGSFLPHGDGFLVASRSYDLQARLHAVDREFRLRRQLNLTEASPWVNSYVGRPRLFRHTGGVYLIGRNWTKPVAGVPQRAAASLPRLPRAQQLCLFRIDPATLQPLSCWVLDNAEQADVSDGYYAVVATTEEGGAARLHVITYKALAGGAPGLVHLKFKWSELTD
jgi:hypothetical protein